ncbi:uncharacterized protein LOC132563295 [Ylistrum balloti]|uniref:uncharacterized protein LOC132563295 n=1 Tax=Ylistrum balloti TaxID=509963 RepID=UPI002905E125|nr:uncharacterized protein LOC132563295 [Ylistrum balloti]
MNGHPDSNEGTPRKTHLQSLPSDYSDVQPSTYDPEFISDISNKMQVPHKLGPIKDEVGDTHGFQSTATDVSAHHMTVPDRILLAGEGQHIGAKENLRLFDMDNLPSPQTVPYVGMMTPPRTLTLEEQGFPAMDIKEEEPKQELTTNKVQQSQFNGSAVQLEPYTPGASMNDSLLLNEEDETTLLKKQVAKLTRKVTHLEEENIRRSYYDRIVYILVFGQIIWKFGSKFFSLVRPGRY